MSELVTVNGTTPDQRLTALAQLKGELAFCEREYTAAEMIDNSWRMHQERAYWRSRIARLKALIAELEK
jgi:hypothetical protein